MEKLFAKSLADCTWPVFDPALAREAEITLVVQVNGKVRANIPCTRGTKQKDIQHKAELAVDSWLKDKEIVKIIFVPDRLINFVIKI